MIPFNQVASSLLMERTYFRPLPKDTTCHLAEPNECESSTNLPLDCPQPLYPSSMFSLWDSGVYQPPLPEDVTIEEEQYKPLLSNDIDCTQPLWQDGCTKVYCHSFLDGTNYTKFVMSIPYFMAVFKSKFLCHSQYFDKITCLVDISGVFTPIIRIFCR